MPPEDDHHEKADGRVPADETSISRPQRTESIEKPANTSSDVAAERKAKTMGILMAMLTAGLLLIGGLQWYEAHTSGADTKHLSQATGDLAAAANSRLRISAQERQLSQTQLFIIKDSAMAAKELAKRAGDAVEKMEEANRIHQAEITSVQRAFITVDELCQTRIKDDPEHNHRHLACGAHRESARRAGSR